MRWRPPWSSQARRTPTPWTTPPNEQSSPVLGGRRGTDVRSPPGASRDMERLHVQPACSAASCAASIASFAASASSSSHVK